MCLPLAAGAAAGAGTLSIPTDSRDGNKCHECYSVVSSTISNVQSATSAKQPNKTISR